MDQSSTYAGSIFDANGQYLHGLDAESLLFYNQQPPFKLEPANLVNYEEALKNYTHIQQESTKIQVNKIIYELKINFKLIKIFINLIHLNFTRMIQINKNLSNQNNLFKAMTFFSIQIQNSKAICQMK